LRREIQLTGNDRELLESNHPSDPSLHHLVRAAAASAIVGPVVDMTKTAHGLNETK
jgi:hypothetical protein